MTSRRPAPSPGPARARPHAVLAAAGLVHFLHDGFSDILYVLLPVWAREFGLAYAQVGALKTLYTGGLSLFQIPAGLLAERRGERNLLAVGTAVTALGFVAAGSWAAGFTSLAAFLLVAGTASGVQHPLASSLVSKAFETGPRRAALGTYNFTGDLGKIAIAGAAGVTIAAFGWRTATSGYGLVGLVGAVGVWGALAFLRVGAAESGVLEDAAAGRWGISNGRGFAALATIGMIDNGTRSGMLVFLPFALVAKGSTTAGIGAALALLFVGGAAGKLVCGLLAERLGVIRTVVLTEAATALGIVAVILAPLGITVAVLIPLGIALNGTSSVLYATVADLVVPARRSRAYGLYYTVALGASALAPLLFGVVGDAIGVAWTLVVIAGAVLVTIPLALRLRAIVGGSILRPSRQG